MKTALTGAGGFLGGYIRQALGADVTTLGRRATSTIQWDFKAPVPQLPAFKRVVHVAGKAHSIPKNKAQADEFFDVNLTATQNLLAALSATPPSQFVFISTVAVYGRETGVALKEDEPLNGVTPYALSKIEAEQAIQAWGEQHACKVLILRLPLITGEHPPGNLNAMANAIKRGYYLRIGSGSARKSMVGAPDVASLIARSTDSAGVYNLTDGVHPSISEVDVCIAKQLNKRIKIVPEAWLNVPARLGDFIPGFPLTTSRLQKLNSTLTFDDRKARLELGWNPQPALNALKP
jgi:nucleoside-diphosphate-sugar epimerase